ncbi:MAG: PhzF family phenazine biosynthesis protein, partial [Candidatus Atribacteria bacterium]
MPELKIKQVDAFTSSPFCGNPAGVISDADELTSNDMLRIAGEMNLAETAFIMMPSSPDSLFRIRYFTPTEEIDLSGHVTIACCYSLIEDKRITLKDGITTVGFETNVGNIA